MTENVYRSSVAQGLFHVDGKPLSFENYPMFYAIYDGKYPRLLLKTSRQVGKSTTIAAFTIAEAISIPMFKSYYISPSREQTLKFSHTRIAKILSYSPELRRNFVGPQSIDNVLLRTLRNGSEMAFTYADDDPDRARGFSSDRCCFAKDTEVLTRTGWVPVQDVTRNTELADVDSSGAIHWHRPSALVKRRHLGNMVRFRHRGLDLRVTDDHNMWVNWRTNDRPPYYPHEHFQFVKANRLHDTEHPGFEMTSRAVLPASAIPSHVELPGGEGYAVSRLPLRVPYLAFAELMGWYIAEGSMVWKRLNGKRQGRGSARKFTKGHAPKRSPKGIAISQKHGKHHQQIARCLRACGLTYAVHDKRYVTKKGAQVQSTFVLISAALGRYCEPLGDSFDKYIPEEFFSHPLALAALLKALHAGDATARDGTLRTRSRRLANDVHRAWTLLGRAAVIHERRMAKRRGGRKLPLYEVQAYKHDYAVFWRKEFETKKRVTQESCTDEPVYCFTVPHHHPIVRGGFGQRPVITGQCFDEVQSITYEAVIPVIEETMSNSHYGYSVYAGTPLTMENTIELLWSRSSMTEWVIKCSGCSKYTFIDSPKALGKLGPECLSCRKPLNPRDGQWVDMVKDSNIKGFHISQPIMPENVPAAWQPGQSEYAAAVERWQKLMYKQEAYGDTRFLNECIGVSTSTGVRLITKEALETLVDPTYEMTRLPDGSVKTTISATYAGIDWSGGGSEVKGHEGLFKSRTVLHIWGQRPDGRLQTMYYKIFPNGHAVGWLDEIAELCNAWGVRMIIGDAGEGALANAMLREKLGAHRVIAVRYMNASKPMDWNPQSMAYHCDRTTLIDNFARFLLHKQAVYPKLPQSKSAFEDILNVYEEVTAAGRKVWKHSPIAPDDCLHASLFGWLAWKIVSQDLKFHV